MNQTAIYKLLDLVIPTIDDDILKMEMEAQTIPGTLNVDISDVTIRNMSHAPIRFTLDSNHQRVHVTIPHVDMIFDTIPFEAWQRIFWRISCFGTITPELYDFDISFSMDINRNDFCTINVSLNQDDVSITDAQTTYDVDLNDGFCQFSFDVANFFVDFERLIYEQIIDGIPSVIESDVELAVMDVIHESRFIDAFDQTLVFCYEDVVVGSDNVYFAGDLVTNITNVT
eukprot:287796_1